VQTDGGLASMGIHLYFLLFRRLGMDLLVWTWASGGRDLRDETLTAIDDFVHTNDIGPSHDT
jgi:hypothetical protein